MRFLDHRLAQALAELVDALVLHRQQFVDIAAQAVQQRIDVAAEGVELRLHRLYRHIVQVLAESSTLEDAAARLGINVTTLWRKRRRYGIE